MAVNPMDVHEGMEVFGFDRVRLGVVDTVPPAGGDGDANTAPGLDADQKASTRIDTFLVQDEGTLGVTAQALRVPYSAILEIQGSRIILNAIAEDCRSRFGRGPTVQLDGSAPVAS